MDRCCQQSASRRRAARGFTLIEMLVVIAIIGVLASLITVAAMNALDTSKQTAIKTELNQINDAFTNFKNKYGAYPPCDLSFPSGHPASNPALLAFIMQAFPRYNTGGPPNYTYLVNDWTNLGIDQTTAHPDRAIVFWLSGFSPDVTQPFSGAGARTPFYQFDQTRLIAAVATPGSWPTNNLNPNYGYSTQYQIGQYVYVPKYGVLSPNAPYAYIDAGHYGALGSSPQISLTSSLSSSPNQPFTIYDSTGTSHGIAAAYVQDLQNLGNYSGPAAAYQFCNPTTFQILSAGQDGQFGIPSQSTFPNGRLYYTGYGYSLDGSDTDNVTNFCDRSRLGDAIP